MDSLVDHPISRRWPAKNPELLQLYSYPTPNGVKVSIALEEMGLAYEAHTVKISGEQHTPEFLALNPNNKIPAIIDPNGPDGQVIALWESGAILLYLAEKSGQLLPRDARARAQTQQWLMFQMGGLGPTFGKYGYFKKFAGKDIEDPRPRQHFIDESRRLLNVLEQQLDGQDYIQSDEYTIADIAIFPWLRAVRDAYGAFEDFQMASYTHTMTYLDRCLDRPAVKRGLVVPPTE
ncbi:glutathione S-transferase N-terminal domain-containing protein [Granulosicoccus antarcticus]|uniref:Disulfide-bond oxidoreductase YfcG n=1 Tax=Granulosicoccus antarcticus IMCC3135 TaxID=1192854 RepID=A0A2Z2NLU2_9GAMM|nr:glutathione S-transferase N-terminal domain-containing protein [Granulosicoccus antarcticus]ASJ72133.1 Disulfide-bond oxidoreductase YfcG [Granulosicoccus antarcticus IMCC3135]